MSALAATTAVLHRDLRRGWRRRGDVAQPLIFFALVVYLFPIAIGPLPETLRTLLPAILWVAAVLAPNSSRIAGSAGSIISVETGPMALHADSSRLSPRPWSRESPASGLTAAESVTG